MKAIWLYRTASAVLILFAIGHTIGFLKFKPTTSEGMAVREAMYNVHFPVSGSNLTYGQFYNGFGLFATAYLLFSAYLAWYLGGLAATNPRAIGALGWVFFALQVASLVLSWIYFLSPPVVLSALAAICTGWAAWLVTRVSMTGLH
jgi:hypothetical protein